MWHELVPCEVVYHDQAWTWYSLHVLLLYLENFEIKEMTKEQKEEVLKNVIDAMIANKTNAEEKGNKLNYSRNHLSLHK